MSATVSLKYVGPHDAVELRDLGEIVERGKSFACPVELAGRAPSGDAGSEDFDPGEGFLAQPDNWQPVKAPAKKAAKPRKRAAKKAASPPKPPALADDESTTEEGV